LSLRRRIAVLWGALRSARAAGECCGMCRHFRNDPAEVEAMFVGLIAMGSGFAAVRGTDGLCLRHGIYLSARAGCADFETAAAPPDRTALAPTDATAEHPD
jgi:hypothetical protein